MSVEEARAGDDPSCKSEGGGDSGGLGGGEPEGQKEEKQPEDRACETCTDRSEERCRLGVEGGVTGESAIGRRTAQDGMRARTPAALGASGISSLSFRQPGIASELGCASKGDSCGGGFRRAGNGEDDGEGGGSSRARFRENCNSDFGRQEVEVNEDAQESDELAKRIGGEVTDSAPAERAVGPEPDDEPAAEIGRSIGDELAAIS